MESIAFIYRSTGDETKEQMLRKRRPSYFSKLACLKSFLNAANKLSSSECRKTFYFCNDAPIPQDRLLLMKKYGKVVDTGGLGNTGSYRRAIDFAERLNSDYVYFAEDDYLYVCNAFVAMLDAFSRIKKADYITLYTIGTIKKNSKYGNWAAVSSACNTWAARTKVLRQDAAKFKLFSKGVEWRDGIWWKLVNKVLSFGILFPNYDQNTWHFLQGVNQFFCVFPKRKLFTSMPSLATHCHADFLAPLVDWEEVSRKAQRLKTLL